MASSTPTRNCEIIAGVPRSKIIPSPPISPTNLTAPTGSPTTGFMSGIMGGHRGYWSNIWDLKTEGPEKNFGDEQIFGQELGEEIITAQFLQRRRSSSGSIDISIVDQIKLGKPPGASKLGPITEQAKKLGERKGSI